MHSIWNTFVYVPMYNALIAVTAVTPGHSVGVAVIVITLAVKAMLLPLTLKASLAQRRMKTLEPKIKELKEKFANDKQQLAVKTMELYKHEGVSPFSGCLPVLVQMPFVIALYFLMWKGLTLNTELLYGFIPHPDTLNMYFFGYQVSEKSVLFAVLAGATQYFQTKFLFPNSKDMFKKSEGKEVNMQEEFTRSLNVQMLYVFPFLIGFIAYTTSIAVALYFITSNIVGIGQEYYIRKTGIK